MLHVGQSTLLAIFLRLSLSTRSATVSAVDSPCLPVNKLLLTNKTKACRCFDSLMDNSELPFWIGCTRDSMPNISLSLNSLQKTTFVDKLWLWDSVIPLVPPRFFEKVKPQMLVLENSMFMEFLRGALDGLGDVLTNLELKNNVMEDVKMEYFRRLGKLTRLDLAGNRLKKIDQSYFGNISSLQYLSLYGNRIASIEDGSFKGLRNLKSLSLAGNQLSVITHKTFKGLENLEFLDLHGNQISAIALGAFDHMKRLKHLNLGSNRLSSVVLSDFDRLEKLFLNNNTITHLNKMRLLNLPKLMLLNLDRNRLTDLPSDYFLHLGSSLEILSLTNNKISALDKDSLAHLGKLRTLSLQNNEIAEIPDGFFSHTTKLRDLFLSMNRLTTLNETTLDGLGSVIVLSLAHNQLNLMHRDAFAGFAKLQKLFLNHNQLQDVSNELLFGLQDSLIVLDLSDNPWNCDCKQIRLLSWIVNHDDVIPSMNSIQCSYGSNVSVALARLKSDCFNIGGLLDASTSNTWFTIIGVILGIVSVLMLVCIALLYLQDRSNIFMIVLAKQGRRLTRVPSDMVDLLPKRSSVNSCASNNPVAGVSNNIRKP